MNILFLMLIAGLSSARLYASGAELEITLPGDAFLVITHESAPARISLVLDDMIKTCGAKNTCHALVAQFRATGAWYQGAADRIEKAIASPQVLPAAQDQELVAGKDEPVMEEKEEIIVQAAKNSDSETLNGQELATESSAE